VIDRIPSGSRCNEISSCRGAGAELVNQLVAKGGVGSGHGDEGSYLVFLGDSAASPGTKPRGGGPCDFLAAVPTGMARAPEPALPTKGCLVNSSAARDADVPNTTGHADAGGDPSALDFTGRHKLATGS